MQDEGPLFCSSFCLSEPDYLFKNLPSLKAIFLFLQILSKKKSLCCDFCYITSKPILLLKVTFFSGGCFNLKTLFNNNLITPFEFFH